MPPIIKETALPTSSWGAGGPRESNGGRQQTVALEVLVTVNGVRAIDGSDKREPFSETTKTVLIHGAGAVIRLAAPVEIGQLLFVTNDKSKKEVVCQVVKSKNYRNTSGYVELEFTEPVIGFWGMRFPSDRIAPQTSAAASTTASGSAYAHVPTNVEPLAGPPETIEPSKPSLNISASTDPSKFTGLAGPQSDIVESFESFKTELRSDDHSMSKADFLAPAAGASIEPAKLENSKLQEQLSSLLSAEQQRASVPSVPPASSGTHKALSEATEKLLAMADSQPTSDKREIPAADNVILGKPPSLSTESAMAVEEVKVPAWLQPAARSVATSEHHTPSGEPLPTTANVTTVESHHTPSTPQGRETRSSKPARSVFGKTLLDQRSAQPRASGSGSKGIWLATAAAVILVTAAGATWYLRHSPDSTPNSISAATLPVTTASTAPMSTSPVPNLPPTQGPAPENSTSGGITSTPISNGPISSAPASASVSSSSQAQAQAAVLSERIPKDGVNNNATANATMPIATLIDAAPEISRPSLGKVRLARPKVNRSAHPQAGDFAEPALEMNGDQSVSGSFDSGLVAESNKQPAAPPTPVGGDVIPARMVSSVPPVYPAIARTQRVAGSVRIDALIDANGRVSTMKVVSGPSLLHQAAMDALRQWKYQPAMLDGKPVSMHLTVTVQFHLQ